jgi:hypothetical protein
MQTSLAEVLDKCLTRVRSGEAIQRCIADYPHLRQELEPLLYTALSIYKAPKVSPSDEFRTSSKTRILAQLREMPIQAQSAKPRRRAAPSNLMGQIWNRLGERFARPRMTAALVTIALVSVIGGISFVVAALTLSSQPANLASQSTLSILSGNVQIQSPGSDVWQEANDGITLQASTRVRTMPNSYAMLTFFEGSSLKLEPNTDITIQQVESGKQGSRDIVLKQWLGKTWNRVVKRVDPATHYEIQTPTASAVVRGTLFAIEVDETGSTIVRTTEGLVSVSAQNQEVYLHAGQEATVAPGAPPSEPKTFVTQGSELIITVGMPAVASVCDPTGSSTGYLPSGLGFNQIPGSQSTAPGNGSQVITIPNHVAGVYSLILRCIGDGTSEVVLSGTFKDETIFTRTLSYEVTDNSQWLVKFYLDILDGRITTIDVGNIEPLKYQVPEKIVETKMGNDYAVPIKLPSEPGQSANTPGNCTLTVASTGGGSVTQPGVGTFDLARGTVVKLTAEADKNWVFDRWIGDVVNALSNTTTITMNQDKTVSAKFVRIYMLVVVSSPGGRVNGPNDSVTSYREGEVVQLSAQANEGWKFDGWTGNVADPSSPVTTITMKQAEVVTANFVVIP